MRGWPIWEHRVTDAPRRASFVDRFLFDWYPAEALGVARFYFGLGLTLYLMSQYPQLLLLDPFGVQFHFTRPIWYFGLLGIDHHIPWLNFLVYAAMVASCLLFAFGKWTKPAIVAVLICMFYLKGVRDSFSGDVHHREVPVFALMVLFFVSKCDRMFGIDARRKNLPPIEDWEASWPLRAMQVWIAMFYFWALVAKLRLSGLDWFTDGGRIQSTLISRALRDGLTPAGEIVNLSWAYELAQMPKLVFAIGALVFAFELLFPIILFIRNVRVRLLMVIGAMLFHIANFILMNVQFLLYPFVFVTFFNMMPVHERLKRKLKMKRMPRAEAAAAD
jgi:hypothetical protein